MGDLIEKDIFRLYGIYGEPVLVELLKTKEVLIGAEVYGTAYEEAIRKWRRKLGEIFSILSDTRSRSDGLIGQIHETEEALKKLAAEMDQTVKQ